MFSVHAPSLLSPAFHAVKSQCLTFLTFGCFIGVVNIRNLVSPEKKLFARHLRKNLTPAERVLKQALRRKALGVRFRFQSVIRGFIVDFYCPAAWLIVEVDGSSHYGREAQDLRRDRILSDLGFLTLRLSNQKVINQLDEVLLSIRLVIKNRLDSGLKPHRGTIPTYKRFNSL